MSWWAESLEGTLVALADDGETSVTASYLAGKTKNRRGESPSKATVQAWGRKLPRQGAISGRWQVDYHRGCFAISERPDYEPPPPIVVPDWFELPASLLERRWEDFWLGPRNVLACQLVRSCLSGDVALAPWQRPEVWTEEQQIDLLDSMMRQITIGAFTIWDVPFDLEIEGARAIAGCADPKPRARLIIDGQQRATTLVRAALGHLDHWRWDGHGWSTGRGFLTPSIAVTSPADLMDAQRAWISWIFESEKHGPSRVHGNRIVNDHAARIERTDLDTLVIGGSVTDVIEVYRRLATRGSPHSPEDLAIMEEWAARKWEIG